MPTGNFSTDVRDRILDLANMLYEAAKELEEFRDLKSAFPNIATLYTEVEKLRVKLAEASDEAQLARSTVTDLTIEVERLRSERDLARRWLCNVLSNPRLNERVAKPGKGRPIDFAIEQGWDCFKEDGK